MITFIFLVINIVIRLITRITIILLNESVIKFVQDLEEQEEPEDTEETSGTKEDL